MSQKPHSKPNVSVITPAYNASHFIGQCIESVQAQTFTEWEMLIADDCSKDNTAEIVRSYAKHDPRIKYLRLDKNAGAAGARNYALSRANGRYIAFLDSDDLWLPHKLEKQLAYMQANNFAFTFTSYQAMTEDLKTKLYHVQVPKKISYRQYLRNTVIGCLTVMLDTKKTGPVKMPEIRSSHDMALWLQIMKNGHPAYGQNEVLSTYREVAGSNTAGKWKAAKDVWKVYRNIEKLSWLYSVYCFAGYVANAILKRMS
jgi:teichuronic acid biosynthesis glycosyltransferase TuaG